MSGLDHLDRARLQREITNLRDELLRVLQNDLEEKMARVVAEGRGGMLALVREELANARDWRPFIAEEVKSGLAALAQDTERFVLRALKEHAGTLFVDSVEVVLPELVDRAVARDLLIRAQELARPQRVRSPHAAQRDAWRALADEIEKGAWTLQGQEHNHADQTHCAHLACRVATALRLAAEYRP